MDAYSRFQGVIAIPARLASTRLPNKLLLNQTGRPLLAHVVERCLETARQSAGLITRVIVAGDDEQLVRVAESAGATAVMTGAHHECGTSRIAEAVETLGLADGSDFVINVQGDEPELAPQAILQVARTLLDDPRAQMATLVISMPTSASAMKNNPNAVKAVLDGQGRAIYFSRAPVPFDRNPVPPGQAGWHHHLGIYAYRPDFLMEFARMPTSVLERQEGLEQLRAIEAGHHIVASSVPSTWAGKGIDTAEDYADFVIRHRRKAA